MLLTVSYGILKHNWNFRFDKFYRR